MTRPLVLDLYSCAGGAAVGYHRAGADMIGVDIVQRDRYPYAFLRADALFVLEHVATHGTVPRVLRGGCPARPDLIHMSPPCQHDNPLTKGTNADRRHLHESYTARSRELALRTGIPFVIEQPEGSGEIREDLNLCMDMFYPADYPPPWVQRHRVFELHGVTVPQPPHPRPNGTTRPARLRGHRGYVRGHRHDARRYDPAAAPYVAAYGNGGGKATVGEMRHAMMIDWTDEREELTEAIPPAYTEYIGRHALPQVAASRLDHNGLSTKEMI